MNTRQLKQNVLTRSLNMIILSQLCLIPLTYAEDAVQQLDTIVITADQSIPYTSTKVNIEGFGTENLQKIPASVSILTADLIAEQHARVLSDVVKNDAAIGDGYAAIGYYPNFVSRGFALDLSSSYLINGNVIRGEQNVALENKERVEILKGISAIQSGMSTPGGVVNYVTKRPKDIQALTFSADQHGQFSVATDLGGFWGDEQQFGYRINLVNEQMDSYVDHVEGERYLAALALDWKMSAQSKVELDLEAQRSEQKSVPGYQLLDGKVPENVKWERLLGYQTWGKPVTIDSLNSSLKYSYALNSDWNLGLVAAHSKSRVDDYSSFAYGYYREGCLEAYSCNTFGKAGEYDIYDYQNPDETFKTNQFKVKLDGVIDTNWAQHYLNFDITQTNKSRDRFAGVNEWIGVGNIYTETIDFSPVTANAGPKYQALKSKQTAFTALDRIEWNEHWTTLIGGKWIELDEQAHAYDAEGKQVIKVRDTDLAKFLPQFAISYSPLESTTVYASYAKGLSDGKSAPWFAENAAETLAPIYSEQYEVGFKQQIKQFLLTASLFDLRQDNQYSKPISGLRYFVAEGEQHSQGLELGLNGALTDHLALTSSFALTKARLENVEAVEYGNHQAQNVPKARFATHLHYNVPSIAGFTILTGGQYSSSKYANKEGAAKVAGYSVVDLGAAYQFKLNTTDALLRLNINNLFNKKYWRDAGEFLGDDYLFLGSPRTATLSFNLNF
ncbi:TonB-dependent siderophore receptor [Acinetobacter schindleri]|uniref:TonB-dependent siderophore receptor n=1 Tax=Acinetobacter schindleri TaxID=108981 RepID=UPI000972A5BC|nr:TonB-dependent siderophore receptor [Acinetobacter schindleri]APX64225.1 TonB-dependent ferrichrome receptor precursor protein [Acinetobacter schindleri]